MSAAALDALRALLGSRDWVFDVTVREFGGSFSAEHDIGRKNQCWYDLYTPDTERRLAAALRQATASTSHLPSPQTPSSKFRPLWGP